jgi:hypothetical protein
VTFRPSGNGRIPGATGSPGAGHHPALHPRSPGLPKCANRTKGAAASPTSCPAFGLSRVGRHAASGRWQPVYDEQPGNSCMNRDFAGRAFDRVGLIEPARDVSGAVLEFMPQSRYRNVRGLALNKHGAGPFCRFSIAMDVRIPGVYVVTVAG